MTTRRPVKESTPRRNPMKAGRPLLVGVIATPADLRFALAMRQPPDLFELRLDCLCDIASRLERKSNKLRAPIIITARDPREGGANNLSLNKRRELLSRFLPRAKYLDVELGSARALKPLLAEARKRNVRVILSFHDFESTPSSRSLRAKAASAKTLGANIFKVATLTNKPADLARLVGFLSDGDVDLPVSAMGLGKLGAISRLLLARCGSVLNYGALQQTLVEGQLPIDVLRSAIPR
ncbi:MAG TPA: type I 3-dehydroquinate dehydratase [Chthoniobacterales bacterium]